MEQFEGKFKLAKEKSADVRAIIRKMEGRDYQNEIKAAAIELAKNSVSLNAHEKDCEELAGTVESFRLSLGDIKVKLDNIPAEIINISDVKEKIAKKNNQLKSLNEQNEELESEKITKELLYSKMGVFLGTFDIESVRE